MNKKKKVTIAYSKNQVNEAGRILINKKTKETQRKNALIILNNWRAAHDYPMNTFQAMLRGKVKSLRYSAIVVERLKRTHSILLKLKRNPQMMLSRMQDIGGLRVVVREIDYIYKLRDSLLKARFRHKITREDDYIRKPKTSGYRSLHLVYKYHNQYAPKYNGLQIEIQLRTELQHVWATAVETMGIILQQSLKSDEGSQERKDFFSLVSSFFARKEGCVPLEVHQDKDSFYLKKLLIQSEKKLHVIEKLKTYSNAIKLIDSKLSKNKKGYEHYLLILDIKLNTIKVLGFKTGDLENATTTYLEWEQKFKSEDEGQVVLVAGESLKILSHAYPNYFGDTKKFISLLQHIIS